MYNLIEWAKKDAREFLQMEKLKWQDKAMAKPPTAYLTHYMVIL